MTDADADGAGGDPGEDAGADGASGAGDEGDSGADGAGGDTGDGGGGPVRGNPGDGGRTDRPGPVQAGSGETAVVVGAQMGDEGKGGAVDLYGDAADAVVRYQGGDNAGHTVVVGGETYELSLTPSGVARGTVGVLGNGCVVNPATLFAELDGLRSRGLDPTVLVDARAHVVMPYHRALDGAEEAAKADEDLAAGTTGRGIGPTYEDKAARRGIRVGDLLDPETLRTRLSYVVPTKRSLYADVFGFDPAAPAGADEMDLPVDPGEVFDEDALFERYRAFGERLDREGMVVDAGDYLAGRLNAGDRVLFEGAQGTGLDLDHGSYPYVTSSTPTAGGAAVGTGLAPSAVDETVGAVKAYLSRVGGGPMPTELDGDVADRIREAGGEYGTVTGRPRRVGWLDLPMLRHAARVSGFTGLAVSHVDTLAGMDPLQVCVAYDLDGERVGTMPPTTERWADCEPVYRAFDGWTDRDWEAVAATGYDALPAEARAYLEFVAGEVGAPVYAVGVGPGREDTVVRETPWSDGAQGETGAEAESESDPHEDQA